jgi:hypothetical protein
MVRMRVSLVELSLRTVMGWVPVLKYMLSGAHGILLLCLIFIR